MDSDTLDLLKKKLKQDKLTCYCSLMDKQGETICNLLKPSLIIFLI